MTLNELMTKIKEVCPDAIVSEDMHGELVIATGYKVSGEELVEVETTPMDMGFPEELVV